MHVCVLTLYIILVFLFIMRVLRKLTSPSLNLKFFLKSTRPSLPLKKGLSKTHQSSLTLKGGSTAFPKPLFLMEKVGCTRQYESELSLRSFAQPFPSGDRGCTNRPTRCFFSKTYPSFLPLKEGSTSRSKPLPSQKGKDVPTALLGAQTATL